MLASLKWIRGLGASSGGATGGPGAVRGGALDVLRFVAAMLIVLYHFGAEAPTKLEHLHPVFSRGYLATDFFLMLSGFVLGRAYGRQIESARISDGRFWLKRVARIWPGHLIVLGGFVVFVAVANGIGMTVHNPTRFEWASLPLQAFLIHAWGAPGGDGWNLPSWSLSALIVCYAAFPAIWRMLARLKLPILAPVIGLIAMAAVDLLSWKMFGRAVYDLPFEVGVVRAAPLFLLGACLARAVDAEQLNEAVARVLLWGGLAVFVGVQIVGRQDALSTAALAAIMLGAGRLPVTKPSAKAETAARLSYALFISHTFVGLLWYLGLHIFIASRPLGLEYQWPLWAMGFPLSVAAAWVFDRYLDAPLQRLIAPLISGGQAATHAEPVMTPVAQPPSQAPQQARDQAAS